jgi:hypothetical protein
MQKALAILFVTLIFIPYQVYGQEQANYEIKINGEKYEVNLGREYQIRLESGENISCAVYKKPIMTFKAEFVSFQHRSDLIISSVDLGDGIRQTMTNTALGTLILFQEYSSVNPSNLLNLMLKRLTKEQINYGYKMQIGAYSKTLRDGTRLNGKNAILRLNNDEEHWTALAYGKKDRGFLVITKIDKEYIEAENYIIELMWETLQIEM